MSNDNCPTGILIDISNVSELTTKPLQNVFTSKSNTSLNVAYSGASPKSNFPSFFPPMVNIRSTEPNTPLKKDLDYIDCELLENQTFDFANLSQSSNVSANSDDESTLPCIPHEAKSHVADLKLNSQQLAEVFKEATVVAVRLENYVKDLNKTPPRSPNLTTLLAELSAQKKANSSVIKSKKEDVTIKWGGVNSEVENVPIRRLELELDDEFEVKEKSLESKVDLENKGQLEMKMFQEKQLESNQDEKELSKQSKETCSHLEESKLKNATGICTIPTSSASMLKKISASGNCSSISYSNFTRALQQNTERSVSMSSPQKKRPLKATAMPPPKQLKPITNIQCIRKPESRQLSNSFSSETASDPNKTTTSLTRTSSFNSAPKILGRQPLTRRNSMMSPSISESVRSISGPSSSDGKLLNSPCIRKPQSLQQSNSILSDPSAKQNKPTTTSLTRTSSFNSAPKNPVRQLKRRNSMLSPNPNEAALNGNGQSPSESGALPNRNTNTTSVKGIRQFSGIPQLSHDARQFKVPIPTMSKNPSYADATLKFKRPKMQ